MNKYLVLLLITLSSQIICYSQIPDNLQVTGNVSSGTYTAILNITSDGNVANAANVEFKTYENIKLSPYFSAQAGSYFKASINSSPNIDILSSPSNIGKYEKFEITLSVSNFSKDPFDSNDIDIYAVFWSPSGKSYKVNGFYYTDFDYSENICAFIPDGGHNFGSSAYESRPLIAVNSDWRIRFAPNEEGQWRYAVYCKTDGIYTKAYKGGLNTAFTCTPSNNHGFIKVANNKYLKYDDATPLLLIGENVQNFEGGCLVKTNKNVGVGCSSQWGEITEPTKYRVGGICMAKKSIQELAASGGNYFRHLINITNSTTNFSGDQVSLNSYYYNLQAAYRLDKYIDISKDLGVNMKLHLFPSNSYKDIGFFDINSNPTDFIKFKNYLRYIIARYGYATNLVSWELVDEIYNFEAIVNNVALTAINTEPYKSNILNWFNETKKYINDLDPYHLVSAGGVSWGNLTEQWQYDIVNNMDFTEVHIGNSINFANNANDANCNNMVNPIQDLCSLGAVTGNVIDEIGFYGNLKSTRDNTNKPIFVNSFWEDDHGGARSAHFIDPNGIFTHNNIWMSLFSNSFAIASNYYETMMHPGYYRKAGYFNYYYCTTNYQDVGFSYNQGQLNHLTQIKQFSQNMDFSKNYKSSFINSNGVRSIILYQPDYSEYFGWIQDIKYRYRYLYENNCGYLKDLSSNKPAIVSGVTERFLVNGSGSYIIDWYKIGVDDVQFFYSTTNNSVRDPFGRYFITFTVPDLNGIYGDIAFILRKSSTKSASIEPISGVEYNDSTIYNDSPISIVNLNKTADEVDSKTKALNGQADILIYPNPTSGIISIDVNDTISFEVSLLTSKGINLKKIDNSKQIDLSEYPSGLYFINIKTSKNEKYFKIIKK